MGDGEPFAVVKFVQASGDPNDEDDVSYEVIPTDWLTIDPATKSYRCFYPNEKYSEKQIIAKVKKNEPAPTDGSWPSYPCEVKSTYAEYLAAHLGAKNRISDSSYETDKDFGRGHRKKRVRVIDSESDEAEDVVNKQLVSPKKLSISGGSKGFCVSNKKKAKSPIKVKHALNSQKSQNDKIASLIRKDKGSKVTSTAELRAKLQEKKKEMKGDKVKLVVTCTSPNWKASEGKPSTSTSKASSPASSVKLPEKQASFSKGNFLGGTSKSIPRITAKPQSTMSSQEQSPFSKESSPNSEFNTNSSFLFEMNNSFREEDEKKEETPLKRTPDAREIVTKQLSFSPSKQDSKYFSDFESDALKLLREIKVDLQIVSTNQRMLNMHVLPNEKVCSVPKGMPALPLKSLQMVQAMEEYLKDEDSQACVSIYMSSFISSDPEKERKSVLNVMAHLMSNKVGCNFNFCGTGEKEAFKNTNMWKAIKGAVALKLEDSAFNDAKDAVQVWLKDAPKRYKTEVKDKSSSQQDSAKGKKRPASDNPDGA